MLVHRKVTPPAVCLVLWFPFTCTPICGGSILSLVYFPLFLCMVMYDNEYKTKENKNWTKDRIELQHVAMWGCSGVVVSMLDFRSEGRWFTAQSPPSCCFFTQEILRFHAQWTALPEKCGVSMLLCALTKHATIFGSLWLQHRIFPKGIYGAVIPVREKTIGVITIEEMCAKCSHFRLTLTLEETKIAQPETCEKYFVTKKTSTQAKD